MVERVLGGVCVVATVCILGYVAAGFLWNPSDAWRAELENRLAQMRPDDVRYVTTSDVNFPELQATIAEKPRLWRELVPPPPPPKRRPVPPKPPDLAKMLKNVGVTRTTVGRGEKARVLIKTAQNPRGSLQGIGDKVNGVEILRIERDSILFGVEENGKQYTFQMMRMRR